jgi:hypothetical protein
MRTFLSYLGLILLGFALMLLGADMVTTLEHQGQITLRSFLDVWAIFDRGAVAAFTAWLSTTLPPWCSGAVLLILGIPSWSIGFIGFFVTFFAGHKRDDADAL